MTELTTFVLGLLATWIGLWMNEYRKVAERRKVTYARIYGVLEAEYRLMLETEEIRPMHTLYLLIQEQRKQAYEKPNAFEEFVKVQNELHRIAEEMLKNGALKEPLAKLRRDLSNQRPSDRELLKDRIRLAREELRLNMPPDEDIALLPYTLIPYVYEYRNRVGRLLLAIESLAFEDPKRIEETQFAKWLQPFMENVLAIFQMSEILRNSARTFLKVPVAQVPQMMSDSRDEEKGSKSPAPSGPDI